MTDERTLDEKLETRKIPRFNVPHTKTRENYHGHTTVVRRASCELSAVSMHRLLTLIGPTLLKAISWSDEEAPTEDSSKKALKDVLNLDFDSDVLKTLALSNAWPELKERLANLRTDDLYFHVRNLLLRHLTVGGVPIDTQKDLDETGIDMVMLMPLMFDAMEVNYFSSFAGRSTPSGDESEPAKSNNEARTERPPSPDPPAPKKSSGNVGIKRGGQSGRTRKS